MIHLWETYTESHAYILAQYQIHFFVLAVVCNLDTVGGMFLADTYINIHSMSKLLVILGEN